MNTKVRLGEIVSAYAGRAGPLLPILHDVQAEFGCIDPEAEAQIAEALNLSRAEVHGVVSFYPSEWQEDYAELTARSRRIVVEAAE